MDLIDRLHRRLLAAIPAASGSDSTLEITIADVYQRLIPYRSVRGDLGVMELAEYESALLRLLAGEGDHVALLDPAIQLELRRELASVNPILGIYRDYADAKLRLGRGEAAEGRDSNKLQSATQAPVVSAPAESAPAESARAAPAKRQREGSARQPTGVVSEISPPTHEAAAIADPSLLGQSVESPPEPVSSPEQVVEAKACWSCGRVLPDLSDLLYCPHCGTAQGPVPCRRCAAGIEPDWSFCVRCGTSRNPSQER